MQKFIIRNFLFGSIFSCIFIIVSIFLIEINEELYKDFKIDKNITTIVIGDSHPRYAINDSLIPEMINISLSSEGYLYSYAKLKHILKANEHIKTIMIGFSYHNLSSHYDAYIFGDQSFLLINRYLPLMEYNELWQILKRNPFMIWHVLKSGFDNISDYSKNSYPFIGSYRIMETEKVVNEEDISKRIAHQYYSKNKLYDISNINIQYLIKIVELCQKETVNLMFLNTPLYKDYYENVPEKFINEYDSILKKYDNIMINFQNLTLSKDHFLPDGDHLTFEGAILATEYLKTKMDSIGVK